MPSQFRPRPDLDGVEISVNAGWVWLESLKADPFVIENNVPVKSFEEAREDASRYGYSGYLIGVGFVTDVSETENGDQFVLPAPKPKTVRATYIR